MPKSSSKAPAVHSGLKVYKISEIARELRVSNSFLKRLVQSGELRALRLGNELRIARHDYAAFLRKARGQDPRPQLEPLREGGSAALGEEQQVSVGPRGDEPWEAAGEPGTTPTEGRTLAAAAGAFFEANPGVLDGH